MAALRISRRLVAALALLAVALPLLVTLPGRHFTADDFWFAGHGEMARDPSICTVWASFSGDWLSGLPHRGGWLRPLPRVLFWLNDVLFGIDRPWGYHLTNQVLHLGNTALVGMLAQALLRRRSLSRADWRRPRSAAILAMLLFGIYPPATGAVSWVSGRTDLLAQFFLLATLVTAALRPPFPVQLAALFLSTTLAILSKESGYFTVPMLAMVALWLRGVRGAIPLVASSAAAAALMLGWRFHCLGGMGGYPDQFGGRRLADLVAWPLHFLIGAVAMPGRTAAGQSLGPAAGLLICLIVGGGALAGRGSLLSRTIRLYSLSVILLVLSAIPVLGLPLLPVENDRFLYGAGLGLALLIAGGAEALQRSGPAWRGPSRAAVGALLLLLMAEFIARDGTWTDASQATHRVVSELIRVADANPRPGELPFVIVARNMDRLSYESDWLQQHYGAKVLPWHQARWAAWRLSHGRVIGEWGLQRSHLATGAWIGSVDHRRVLAAGAVREVHAFLAEPALTTGTLTLAKDARGLEFADLAQNTSATLTYAVATARLRADTGHAPVVRGADRTVAAYENVAPGAPSEHFFPVGMSWREDGPWVWRPEDSPGKVTAEDFAVALFPLHEVTLSERSSAEPGS